MGCSGTVVWNGSLLGGINRTGGLIMSSEESTREELDSRFKQSTLECLLIIVMADQADPVLRQSAINNASRLLVDMEKFELSLFKDKLSG